MTRQQQYQKLLKKVQELNTTSRDPEDYRKFKEADNALSTYLWVNRHRITIRSGK